MQEELKLFLKDPPIIETPRLIFRPIKERDADDMYEYACREEVTRYLLWSPHSDLAYTKKYISFLIDVYKKGQYYDWAVILKEEGKMIGTAGFAMIDTKNNALEIGYVLSDKYWHQGFGSEIARELIDFGFSFFGANRIQARYMTGNRYSSRIMEKCGMSFEGVQRSLLFVKDQYRDIGVYSILRKEYLKDYEMKVYPLQKRFRLFG